MIFERMSRDTDGFGAYLVPDDLVGSQSGSSQLSDGGSPTKSNYHIDGCSCMACHAHDDDGKVYQPGGTGTDAEDTIAGGTSTIARLTPEPPLWAQSTRRATAIGFALHWPPVKPTRSRPIYPAAVCPTAF
ncbi:MAG: hypothetical protein WA948_07285 [Pontixanthobacter sp.]